MGSGPPLCAGTGFATAAEQQDQQCLLMAVTNLSPDCWPCWQWRPVGCTLARRGCIVLLDGDVCVVPWAGAVQLGVLRSVTRLRMHHRTLSHMTRSASQLCGCGVLLPPAHYQQHRSAVA